MAYKEIENEKMKFVNELLLSKDSIEEQLKLLKEYKDREDVIKYISDLKEINKSNYLNYLIEKYYEGKENLIVPEKTSVEETFELYLRPVTIKEKIINPGTTDIKVGDKVLIIKGPYENIHGEVISINNQYSEFTVKFNLFGKDLTADIDFDNVKKI